MTFTVETASSATKMRSGGTWWTYERIERAESLVKAALQSYPPARILGFSGMMTAEDGRDLFALDAPSGTLTPVMPFLVRSFGEGPYPIRAYIEEWKGGRTKANLTISLAPKGRNRFSVVLEPEKRTIRVQQPGPLGDPFVMFETVLSKKVRWN